jgi:DnaJ-class molecular chaperone
MSDPYELLGVSKDASDKEIKQAFRKRSLDVHPDRMGGDTEKFQELNAAFDKIKTADLRQKHEMESNHPFGMPGGMGMPGGDEFSDINNVFNMMFGGGMPGGMGGMGGMGGFPGMPGVRIFHGGMPGGMGGHPFFAQQMQKPPPIIKNIELTLAQCYQGCSVAIDIDRWVIENGVRGSKQDKLHINLPPGIDENEVIILRDHGHIASEQLKGDVKLTVTVKNTSPFQRHGLDLLFKKTITLKEALCGFAFEIPHLNGKTLAINNQTNVTVIHPGFRRTVPQMGMKKENNTGNLIIEFDVNFPASLTAEQIDTLKDTL